MSSQSEEEADGLPFDIDEVMSAKRNNPGLFVSAWEADENDLELWSKAQIKADPIKRFIVSAEEGDLATLEEIVTRAQKHVPGASHPSVVELLSAKDADGYSALHRAAYGGHVSTVECIQLCFVDLPVVNRRATFIRWKPTDIGNFMSLYNITAWLMCYPREGSTDGTAVTLKPSKSTMYLLRLGADINIRTLDGWTPLHSAAFWNQFACVQLLLAAGAELNATTNSNQTPLHLAVSNNQTPETLYILLSQPNISVYGIRNQLGDSVADLIIRNTQYADLCFAFSEAATSLGK